MAVTILEALRNAQFNLVKQRLPGITDAMGAEQLNNAIILLEKGYSAHDVVESNIDLYGSIEDVQYKKHLINP